MEENIFNAFLEGYTNVHNKLVDVDSILSIKKQEIERLNKIIEANNLLVQSYMGVKDVDSNDKEKREEFKMGTNQYMDNIQNAEKEKANIAGKQVEKEKLEKEIKAIRKNAKAYKEKILEEERIKRSKDETRKKVNELIEQEDKINQKLEKFKGREPDTDQEAIEKIRLENALREVQSDKKVLQQKLNQETDISEKINKDYILFLGQLSLIDKNAEKVGVENKEDEKQTMNEQVEPESREMQQSEEMEETAKVEVVEPKEVESTEPQEVEEVEEIEDLEEDTKSAKNMTISLNTKTGEVILYVDSKIFKKDVIDGEMYSSKKLNQFNKNLLHEYYKEIGNYFPNLSDKNVSRAMKLVDPMIYRMLEEYDKKSETNAKDLYVKSIMKAFKGDKDAEEMMPCEIVYDLRKMDITQQEGIGKNAKLNFMQTLNLRNIARSMELELGDMVTIGNIQDNNSKDEKINGKEDKFKGIEKNDSEVKVDKFGNRVELTKAERNQKTQQSEKNHGKNHSIER